MLTLTSISRQKIYNPTLEVILKPEAGLLRLVRPDTHDMLPTYGEVYQSYLAEAERATLTNRPTDEQQASLRFE